MSRARSSLVLGLLALGLLVAVIASLGIGAFRIPPRETAAMLLHALGLDTGVEITAQQEAVLYAIRLPRVLLSVLVGAGLAAAFVIVMGARVMPELSRHFGVLLLSVAAFLGGLALTLTIYRIATRAGHASLPVMLLAGVAANALALSGIGLLSYVASDEQSRTLVFWSLGSLSGANWTVVAICLPCVALSLFMALRLARPLNAILLGEAEAGHLGVNVKRLKAGVIGLATLAVGVLVAFTGIIAFIGLIAPHMIRLLCGPDHRTVIPGAALMGALMTVAADLAARTIVAPAELPIGILTTLLGAPFFLGLLMRQRTSWGA
ncbi:MAG: iron ABC transporter permease [Candidatus Protistobacter heckmanni]|nr:iron ABC transporter permease [Candidatus Protistobacter heckmanni]